MSTLVQFLLIVVISTLTLLVTLVAIQVFKLIQEARGAVRKLSQLLDNTQTISESAARPIAAVNQFFSEVKELVDTTENQIVAEKISTPSRHFFHRAGQLLRHPTRPS